MKRILLIAIVFFTHISAKSQTKIYHSFPDSNAIWNFHYSMYCFYSGNADQYYSLFYSGDTMVKGQKYSKLTIAYVQSVISGSCPGSMTAGYQGGIRQDSAIKRVFFLPPSDSIEQLLYDFNMITGDTVKGFIEPSCSAVIVKSIDSVLVGSNY